ncbi:hypothetical protein MHLP_01695 [Candidatus Mycoplasma haematolamae str. Purdue]|uniref:Uncharacterized protein n=1 Tax=Mycoplasma haematolamae (strain Purdue) TaxID=1212765 RepID=I7CJ78_MYCHA|nr:hypothetical protein [Candidatus Mycoplasma haematolamae]AFO51919.1 hypothetical protein MHLP_01695 [Candidatus Mycoplasma haematolamae str. Purdue]
MFASATLRKLAIPVLSVASFSAAGVGGAFLYPVISLASKKSPTKQPYAINQVTPSWYEENRRTSGRVTYFYKAKRSDGSFCLLYKEGKNLRDPGGEWDWISIRLSGDDWRMPECREANVEVMNREIVESQLRLVQPETETSSSSS